MIPLNPNTQPEPLKVGDEVITVATSHFLDSEEQLLNGYQVLKSWGLICRPHQIIGRRWGYLAGKDNQRFQDLHPKEPAPLFAFARGGWGAARLLEKSHIWGNGWLFGYSDVTSILLARLAAGFHGNVHGPLICDLAKEPEWSKNRLKCILFGERVPDLKGEPWIGGTANGPVIVANLTVASHLIGTKYLPDMKGSILLLEDIGEEPYRIDRMLTQWRLAGLLQGLAGIGFGIFKDCQAPLDSKSDETFSLQEVLEERCKDLGIPVVGNLPIGHIEGNASLPLGRMATIDGNKGSLSLLA